MKTIAIALTGALIAQSGYWLGMGLLLFAIYLTLKKQHDLLYASTGAQLDDYRDADTFHAGDSLRTEEFETGEVIEA